jgi:hypothetical protein
MKRQSRHEIRPGNLTEALREHARARRHPSWSRLRQLGWLIALWMGGVLVLGLAALSLRTLMGLAGLYA